MSSKNKQDPYTVTLVCGNRTRQLESPNFFKLSESCHQPEGVLQLDDYDPGVVDFLPEFIETRRLQGKMSFFLLKDLLGLAKKFQLEEMKQLLEYQLLSLATNEEHIIQALILAENVHLSEETIHSLISLSAAVFLRLAASPEFSRIPPRMMCLLLGECQLAVDNELQLIDAALFWLSKQHFVDYLTPLVFNMIRTASLDSASYFKIMQRVADLGFSHKTSRYISILLTSNNSARVCCHENSKISRCSGAFPIPSDVKMALSLPDDRKWIKIKKLV